MPSLPAAKVATSTLFIHHNYQDRISLADMAARMNMSPGYFCRFFRSTMNKSPFEYLNAYRITRAAALLDGGNMKISQIAQETGFDNFSYFTEVFKKIMHCTPSQYRKARQPADPRLGQT